MQHHGEGAFACVYRCSLPGRGLVAAKVVDTRRMKREKVLMADVIVGYVIDGGSALRLCEQPVLEYRHR